MARPINQPMKMPFQPDCSPIHLTRNSRGTSTSKKPAKQNPNSSGSHTSCNNPQVVCSPRNGKSGLFRYAKTIINNVKLPMTQTEESTPFFPFRRPPGPAGLVGFAVAADSAGVLISGTTTVRCFSDRGRQAEPLLVPPPRPPRRLHRDAAT